MTRRKFQGAKRIDSQSTNRDPRLQAFEGKLRAWLMQQPEWVLILSQSRAFRKVYAKTLVDAVVFIPPYVSDPPQEPRRMNITVGGGGAEPAEGQGQDTPPPAPSE